MKCRTTTSEKHNVYGDDAILSNITPIAALSPYTWRQKQAEENRTKRTHTRGTTPREQKRC